MSSALILTDSCNRESYLYLLRALRTFPSSESSTPACTALAHRALSLALQSPSHYDFHDLTSLDAIQSLRSSDATHYELLEIFTAKLLDDYDDFLSEHPSFLADEKLDETVLYRKMRLLTLSSLAASAPNRILPYTSIAKALQIPTADVEMWAIDVIRAGLVEGKLSQQNQTFLVHRSTYRVFGERQWQEVASRLATWQESLKGVLAVIRAEREHVEAVKEREAREAEGRMGGGGGGSGGMAGGRRVGGGGGGGMRREGGGGEPLEVGLD
jgi:translation initiation factor 3 subunit M